MRTPGRVKIRNELLLINVCSLVLILIITLVDVQALRIVVGLPFLLFFPGYTLVAAFFPRGGDLGGKERIALSVGLSVLITPSVGLILTHFWGIRLYPVLVSLTLVIAALSAAAWYRRRRCAEEDRVVFAFNLPFGGGRRHNVLDGVVSVALVLTVAGAVGVMAYAFTSPERGERFTEFYIVGGESIPREVAAGDRTTVTLGIVNQEDGAMSYSVDALVGGMSLAAVGPIGLDRGGAWEGQISFAPPAASGRTRLTEEVTILAGDAMGELMSVRVETTAGLVAGDHLMIGQEAAVAESIEGNTIITVDGLKQYHAPGTEVVEVQKAEFRLFKHAELSGDETSLALWVGKERLVATVQHLGAGKASYWIRVSISGGQGEAPVTRSVVGLADQATGDVWTSEIDYPFSEMNQIQIALFKDDGLLYETSESEPYPSLHVWMVVS